MAAHEKDNVWHEASCEQSNEVHLFPVNSPHIDHWRRALTFSLICAPINGWVNNREAGDLTCHHAHYDVIIMILDGLLLYIHVHTLKDKIWKAINGMHKELYCAETNRFADPHTSLEHIFLMHVTWNACCVICLMWLYIDHKDMVMAGDGQAHIGARSSATIIMT